MLLMMAGGGCAAAASISDQRSLIIGGSAARNRNLRPLNAFRYRSTFRHHRSSTRARVCVRVRQVDMFMFVRVC